MPLRAALGADDALPNGLGTFAAEHAALFGSPGISYDGSLRLFRLRCKDSVYVFRVDDQKNLEHLYWGPSLPAADDISYLAGSHVPGPFDPRGEADIGARLGLHELKTIVGEGDLFERWRVFTREGHHAHGEARWKTSRLENAAWRLWHMERMKGGDLNRDLSVHAVNQALRITGSLEDSGSDIRSTLGGGRAPHSPGPRRGMDSGRSSEPSPPIDMDVNASGGVRRSFSLDNKEESLSTVFLAGSSNVLAGLDLDGDRSSQYRSAILKTPTGRSNAVPAIQRPSDEVSADAVLPVGTRASAQSAHEASSGLISPMYLGGHDPPTRKPSFGFEMLPASNSMTNEPSMGLPGTGFRAPNGMGSRKPSFAAVETMESMEALGSAAFHLSEHSHSLRSPSLRGALDLQGSFAPANVGNSTGLRSPGFPSSGMGSRKRSFPAAIESFESVSDLVGAGAAATTNWEKLDPELVGKSSKLLEFSDVGTGDFREPSFKIRYQKDGSSVSPLEYSKHRIIEGKPPMPDYMPFTYIDSPAEATTLVVEMVDRVTKLQVNLYYTVYHDYDVITRRSVIVNESDQAVTLHQLVSATVDFDAESTFYMTQLSGGWARERQIVTRKLDDGLTVVKSSRGASSHQCNPFMVISPDREPDEKEGECFAFCLVYSGNFLGTAEVTEYRRLRVNLGINPEVFTWHLDPVTATRQPASFCSPEVVMTYSNTGLGGMSRQLHRLFRERLTPKLWRYKVPPVLLNTWEAAYFNVSHDVVVDIARKAATAGIELLVLDDGWFGKRDNAQTGLGDWTPNFRKLPMGLGGLADEVNQFGIKFGIWVEPEMVSTDSDLYRKHPDWCLHAPSRSRTTGRNQLVLDFSRKCVRDNIYKQLEVLLKSANIEYVKWDMNRHLTEVFSQDWDADRQGEIGHRYMLGVYEVFGRITAKFPHVLFESCSGGGGRFDAGMLFYSPQIWASDNTDALSRVRIQYGTSLAYPASTMGAHVSTVPNHQTLRWTTVKTRSLLAMSGTFGYELDPREMTETDTKETQQFIALHKRIAHLVYEGDLYRLRSPFLCDSAAWMFVARSKAEAVVIATNVQRDVGRLEPRLKLDGLKKDMIYTVEELCPGTMARNNDTGSIEHEPRGVYQFGRILRLSGHTLCRAGLPVKFVFDADSVIFELKEVGPVQFA